MLALDLLDLVELAWQDCNGEITPSDDVIGDMLLVSAGTIEGLIRAAILGVTDRRDLRVSAENVPAIHRHFLPHAASSGLSTGIGT